MKQHHFKFISFLVLSAIVAITLPGCQKSALLPDPSSANALSIADEKDNPTSPCKVTYTDDDLFGYAMEIFYNEAGDPDSISFSGFPIKMTYDAKGRLSRSDFGTGGIYFEYLYNGREQQPAVLNYYYPGITYPENNGIIAVYHFNYNAKGEMINRGINNKLFPQYNSMETYEYDQNSNVTKVSIAADNGGTVFIPGYVENEATAYDHQRNFMAGNKWLKFILWNSGAFIADYFRLYSKNNAVEWTWGFDGGYNPLSAIYEYDADGFATKISMHLFDIDGVTELLALTENSLSTCDDGAAKPQQKPAGRPQLLPRNLYNLPGTLPLSVK